VLPGTTRLPCAIAITSCIVIAMTISAAPKQGATAIGEIRSVLRMQQDAWNHGDIDRFMNGYAHSRHTVFVAEDTVRRGWETVRDRYREKYSDRAKMGVLTFSDLEIVLLSPDSAVALGRWKLQRAKDRPHGRFTLIFRRLPEGWRIMHDRRLRRRSDWLQSYSVKWELLCNICNSFNFLTSRATSHGCYRIRHY
jgi:ketosteroid isomerase-like protein